MRRHPLVLAVFLSACATYSGAYEQAAPAMVPVGPPPVMTPSFAPGTPSAPVYTPAGAGLYDPSQPGQQGGSFKRSPNTRVLPDEYSPKKEPGLWAADELAPRASMVGEPWLLNTYLPELEGVPESEHLASLCAAQMAEALKRLPPGLMRAVDEGEPAARYAQRPCLAMRLYLFCAELHLTGRVDEGGLEVAPALANAAKLVKEQCPEHADTGAVHAVLAAIRARYLN